MSERIASIVLAVASVGQAVALIALCVAMWLECRRMERQLQPR